MRAESKQRTATRLKIKIDIPPQARKFQLKATKM